MGEVRLSSPQRRPVGHFSHVSPGHSQILRGRHRATGFFDQPRKQRPEGGRKLARLGLTPLRHLDLKRSVAAVIEMSQLVAPVDECTDREPPCALQSYGVCQRGDIRDSERVILLGDGISNAPANRFA